MPILPVLDVMHGHVVRGRAGQRAAYRPLVSQLTRSTHPLDVARALHEHFGFRELYLADLDAIAGAPAAVALYAELLADGFALWIDPGIRTADAVGALLALGPVTAVLALESMPGPEVLHESCRRHGPDCVVFSLDLHAGRPLGNPALWGSDPWTIAKRALAAGVRRVLLLDLAAVGVSAGPTTSPLCARLRREHPDLQLTTGGGVRGPEDVHALYAAGADYVLVASALHDGRLTPAHLALMDRR